jgi:uncharacterized membrane protein YvbJ
MRGALRVRERRCPTCQATARGSDARWCGTCGDPLDPGGEAARADHDAPSRHRRSPRSLRALALVAGVGGVVALLAAGGAFVERSTSGPSTAVRDVAVAAPDAEAVSRLEREPPTPIPDRTESACARGGTDDCFL